jgi:glucose-1-phosphate thymidylyltransferase
MRIGVIPAAGAGSRIQPLAFSKELLPVGSRMDDGIERPRAVSEYLIERMIAAGADRLCFVISPEKSDIVSYFGNRVSGVPICYVVQPRPAGLCDALFSALPFLGKGDTALVGLPDTVWFPTAALSELPDDLLSFLLFPVEDPQLFDAVVLDGDGYVLDVQVKAAAPSTSWVWGAFKVPGATMYELEALWRQRGRRDEFFGSLVNAHLRSGGKAVGVPSGTAYVDVGTFNGYRRAIRVLEAEWARGDDGAPFEREEHHDQARRHDAGRDPARDHRSG